MLHPPLGTCQNNWPMQIEENSTSMVFAHKADAARNPIYPQLHAKDAARAGGGHSDEPD